MPRIQYKPSADSSWSSLRLNAQFVLPGEVAGGVDAAAVTAVLITDQESGTALIAGPDARVRINGRAVQGGLRVLKNRDEIRVDGRRFFFSALDPLAVEAYSGPAINCPRCSGNIEKDSSAVRCRCGAWFHQSAEKPCFTYGDSCPTCSGSTLLEEDPWDPSGL